MNLQDTIRKVSTKTILGVAVGILGLMMPITSYAAQEGYVQTGTWEGRAVWTTDPGITGFDNIGVNTYINNREYIVSTSNTKNHDDAGAGEHYFDGYYDEIYISKWKLAQNPYLSVHSAGAKGEFTWAGLTVLGISPCRV
jgi:hypothetical protein